MNWDVWVNWEEVWVNYYLGIGELVGFNDLHFFQSGLTIYRQSFRVNSRLDVFFFFVPYIQTCLATSKGVVQFNYLFNVHFAKTIFFISKIVWQHFLKICSV